MNYPSLLNYFVVGVQKSATTLLHHYLSGHPDIYMPPKKETHFFGRDVLFKMGLDYYEETFFSNWNKEKRVSEINPVYMCFTEALRS